MPNFGEKLKRIRTAAGMSQQELADKAGVSQDAISKWEMGTREPLISAVKKLCDALNVTCDVFFAKEEPEPEKPAKGKKKGK